MKSQFLAITFLISALINSLPLHLALAVEKNENNIQKQTPEDFVVCTGWHALCSASLDCKMNGDKADCDCLRVNENHVVATSEIQDLTVKRQTLLKCTTKHPCAIDKAPVCMAIKSGQYKVDNVKYKWVSTYSYRGWCHILEGKFVPCDQKAPGYSGDLYWAICDAAPCTENLSPSNPEKPLRCQCRVMDTPFVGLGSCRGASGGIMSSFPLSAWDFQKNTYPFSMPGYEYVQSACGALKSDPVQ
ncbi:MAG: hypothetical protein ACXVCY_06060 [Pseudobdellovibrionaceae bacterium]